MFLTKLKLGTAAVLCAGLFVALIGGAAIVSGGASGTASAAVADPKPAPQPVAKDDPAAALVRQLDAPDFKARQEAAKKLRDLGAKAIPALQAGTRGQSLEATRRSHAVLAAVRADLRDALAKQFDPKKKTEYDHPVWKRFVGIAGDSRASRELFARIIANEKWLRTLDNAEADPASAGHVYRVGIAEVFRDFHSDPAKNPQWPCDRPEEVAYLLLLGSYPDNNPPAKLTGDEVVPENLRNTDFLGRGIIRGEGQITHANGLDLGLDGKIRFFNAPEIVGAVGTDRVFARLFAAWLVRRDPSSEVVRRGFLIAFGRRVPEILPLARHYAANDFEPKRDVPPIVTITALELVAQLGTRADLPLFERHFADRTNVAAVDKPRADGAMDYYRPAPVTETTQLRDVALGLTLLLHGANPEDFGFVVRKDTFKEKDGRYTIPWSTQLHLGFESEASRTATFKKAKAWLVEQKPKVEPPAAQPSVPAAKEGRIYFWLDQRLASVQPDGKDFKWHSKVMVNSSGLPNVAHLGDLRISPDGRRVAFNMGAWRLGDDVKTDIDIKLRVLSLDKEEPIIDLGRYANDKVWSPDGAKLACSFVEYDETEDRFHRSNWMIDVKTKEKTTLKLPAGHLVMDWSSDGNWFLTSAEINAKEAKVKPARQSTHVSQIYLVKRDGSEVRPLTDLNFSATEGRFSPDGRMILFHGRDPKGDTWHIHAMDLKERKPWKVSQELDGGVSGACWSPDGKRIAYVYGKTSDEKGDGLPEILFRQAEHFLMVVDADGKNSATLRSEKNQVLRITLRAADWR
jgi:hypothetical protein